MLAHFLRKSDYQLQGTRKRQRLKKEENPHEFTLILGI